MIRRTCLPLIAVTFIGALGAAALAQEKAATRPARTDPRAGDAYTLATCPISGKKLADPVVKIYDGREARFCCNGCPSQFESDKNAGWTKVDAAMIKDQLPHYPLDTSVVSGKKLEKPVDFVWNNRLVRLADESEKAAIEKDARTYIAALDKAVIEKQSGAYPLTECPMMGDSLDPADTKNVVVANRLVKVCCSSCIGKVRKNPAKALAALDAASAKPSGGQ